MRDSVGEGYILQGVVRSAAGCAPIAGAQIEFWMAGPNGEYTDDYRATQLSGDDGAYHFESHFPPPYSGRPPHIHLKVSAEGYQTLITQHYPKDGDTSASLDLVLVPQP
jgi:protocatechuate 3,4-dioxygenase beta subunit